MPPKNNKPKCGGGKHNRRQKKPIVEAKPAQCFPLLDLPECCVAEVLAYLSGFQDKLRMLSTCRAVRQLATNRRAWQHKWFFVLFTHNNMPTSEALWLLLENYVICAPNKSAVRQLANALILFGQWCPHVLEIDLYLRPDTMDACSQLCNIIAPVTATKQMFSGSRLSLYDALLAYGSQRSAMVYAYVESAFVKNCSQLMVQQICLNRGRLALPSLTVLPALQWQNTSLLCTVGFVLNADQVLKMLWRLPFIETVVCSLKFSPEDDTTALTALFPVRPHIRKLFIDVQLEENHYDTNEQCLDFLRRLLLYCKTANNVMIDLPSSYKIQHPNAAQQIAYGYFTTRSPRCQDQLLLVKNDYFPCNIEATIDQARWMNVGATEIYEDRRSIAVHALPKETRELLRMLEAVIEVSEEYLDFYGFRVMFQIKNIPHRNCEYILFLEKKQ